MTPHEKAVEAAAHALSIADDSDWVWASETGLALARAYRAFGAATITAYLASMEAQGWVMVEREASLAPPNTELGEPKKAFADTFSAQTAMLAAKEG